jgi:predicted KAP-like P-loop ATPase
MWSDIETRIDYLNYLELAEVVSEILLDPKMRPVSVGVFGTWGTGKSSLLNLIEDQLRKEADDRVIIIRFDAWLYQGYDDARAALMEVIARTLYESAKNDAGLLGLSKRLLARVNTLRTLGLGIEVVAALHGFPLLGAGSRAIKGVRKILGGEPSAADAQAAADGVTEVGKLIDPATAQSPPQEIDAFRKEFRQLLVKLDKTLVVFVDNLDRCLPAQAIHTLEALRLFLFIEESAFVVAADEEMVRQSVRKHFDGASERHITDYLDKLIQIPVRVPRLGITEIRAYLFMLFAEISGVDRKNLDALRGALELSLRRSWTEPPIGLEDVGKRIGADDNLRASFDTADRMAALLATSDVVLGNPRIIKRLLNVVRLRARIARRREMPIDEGMVAKFAIFERCVDSAAISKLYGLVNEASEGKSALIIKLETLTDEPKQFEEALPGEWKGHIAFLHDWMQLKPALGGVDLRPLVYLSKETTALRAVGGDLSQAAADAVRVLVNVRTMASPAASMAITAIPPGEEAGVMRELVAVLRAQTDWSKRPNAFSGAAIFANANPQVAGQLAALIGGLPGKKPAWLTAQLKDLKWAKGVA